MTTIQEQAAARHRRGDAYWGAHPVSHTNKRPLLRVPKNTRSLLPDDEKGKNSRESRITPHDAQDPRIPDWSPHHRLASYGPHRRARRRRREVRRLHNHTPLS